MKPTYNIVAIFADGTTETLRTGYTCRDAANEASKHIWFNDYNSGRSERTPSMGHNSGIVDIGTVTEGSDE